MSYKIFHVSNKNATKKCEEAITEINKSLKSHPTLLIYFHDHTFIYLPELFLNFGKGLQDIYTKIKNHHLAIKYEIAV